MSTKRRKSEMTTEKKVPHHGDLPPLERKKTKEKAKKKVAKEHTKNLHQD